VYGDNLTSAPYSPYYPQLTNKIPQNELKQISLTSVFLSLPSSVDQPSLSGAVRPSPSQSNNRQSHHHMRLKGWKCEGKLEIIPTWMEEI
jgi:hypothetical protein